MNLLKLMPAILNIEKTQPNDYEPIIPHLVKRHKMMDRLIDRFPKLKTLTETSFPMSDHAMWLEITNDERAVIIACSSCNAFYEIVRRAAK